MKKLTYLSGVAMKKLTYLGLLIVSTIVFLFAVEAIAQEKEDTSPMAKTVPYEVYCTGFQELKSWLNSKGERIVFQGRSNHQLALNSVVYFFIDPESGDFSYVIKNPNADQACMVDHGNNKPKYDAPKVES